MEPTRYGSRYCILSGLIFFAAVPPDVRKGYAFPAVKPSPGLRPMIFANHLNRWQQHLHKEIDKTGAALSL